MRLAIYFWCAGLWTLCAVRCSSPFLVCKACWGVLEQHAVAASALRTVSKMQKGFLFKLLIMSNCCVFFSPGVTEHAAADWWEINNNSSVCSSDQNAHCHFLFCFCFFSMRTKFIFGFYCTKRKKKLQLPAVWLLSISPSSFPVFPKIQSLLNYLFKS